MHITDLNGCTIEVTDLEEAISITEEYSQYRHEDKSYRNADKMRKAYWTDMHDKLRAIREQLENT